MSERPSPQPDPSGRSPAPHVVRATVRAVLPNGMYRVESEGARPLRAHLSGEARALLTRLVSGDEVLVEVSEAGGGECRIVGRPRGSRGR